MNWLFIILIVILLIWIITLRDNIKLLNLDISELDGSINRIAESKNKIHKELLDRLDKTEDNISEVKESFKKYVLKREYIDIYRKSKSVEDKFSTIFNYWLDKNLDGYKYDSAGCEHRKSFILLGVDGNKMIINQTNLWDEEEYDKFTEAFSDIVQDEYEIYFPIDTDNWEDEIRNK